MEWSKFIECIKTDIRDITIKTTKGQIEKGKIELSDEEVLDVVKTSEEMVENFMSIAEIAGQVVAAHVLGNLVAETYYIYLKIPNNKYFPGDFDISKYVND